MPLLPEYIYLGGAPHDMLHVRYSPPQPQPSKMCEGTLIWWCLLLVCGVASSASLLGRERWAAVQKYICQVDLFGDAVTGQDIIECDSAICNEQPCHNGGVCNQDPSGTAWFCDCAPGFTGILKINDFFSTSEFARNSSQVLFVRGRSAMQTPAYMEAPVLGRAMEMVSSAFARLAVEVASVKRRSRN